MMIATSINRSRLVILFSILMLVSALPFVTNISKAQPGQWSDTFADESKILTKVNAEVVGGNAQIQQLVTNYTWQEKGVVVDQGGLGEPDSKYVTYPWILKGSDGVYRMWYSGVTTGDTYRILYATSPDGYNWTKRGPVISPGFSGTGYDSERVFSTTVMYDEGQYKMWYTGQTSSDVRRILYANSTDGETWEYRSLALDVGGAGETQEVAYPSVIKDGGTYKMWYSGYPGGSGNWQIFHATSADSVSWTKQGLVMPIGSPGDDDDYQLYQNAVIKNSTGVYRMWYGASGTALRILYAESPDGIDWSNRYGVSLYEGPSGSLDESRVSPGNVLLPVDNAGWIWYAGYDSAPSSRVFVATMGSLGNLTSVEITKPSGYDWQKLFLNKTIHPYETEVLVSVLNATTLTPYPGLSDLKGTEIDLSSISRLESSIRLRADFYGNISQSPFLHDWTVVWDDISGPDFGGLKSAIDDGNDGNVTLSWDPAADPSIPITYNVYMSLTSMGQDFGTANYTTLATSLQITGLTNGVTYYFVVRAEDSLGHEENNLVEKSAMPTTPIDSTPPTFAGLQSATDSGTDGNVTLDWNAATDPNTIECNSDPSLPIAYNIYYSETPGGQDFATPNATTTSISYEVTGLLNGRTYHIVVRAEDSAGNEEQNSIELSAMPTTPVDSTPPAFTGLESVTDLGTGGDVRLTWIATDDPDTVECNSDPSLPITYNIYYSRVSGAQDFFNPNATTANTQIDISGLQNGVFYYFVVRAEDSVGNEETNLIEKSAMPTTPVDSTPPDFLGLQFAIDAGTGGTVTLSWLTATDPDTPECNSDPSLPIGYDIFYSSISGGQDFLSPSATTPNPSISISGLTNGVPYYFVVRARDGVGNEESNTIERMAIPTTPTDSTAPDFAGLESAFDSQTGGNVTLTWSAATDPDTMECNSDPSEPTTYSVYASTIPGNQNFLLPNATTQNTQIEITGLKNGVTYYFVVRAKDAVGNEESNTVEMSAMPTTPVDDAPPDFSGLVTAIDSETGGSVDLYWAEATDPDLVDCNSDPSLPITYNIYYSTTPGGQDFSTPDATTLDIGTQITGLQNGGTYYFVVRAQDSAGNEETNTVTKSTSLRMPEKPFNLLDYWWLFLIIAVVVVAVVLAVVLARRRKKEVPIEKDEEETKQVRDETPAEESSKEATDEE